MSEQPGRDRWSPGGPPRVELTSFEDSSTDPAPRRRSVPAVRPGRLALLLAVGATVIAALLGLAAARDDHRQAPRRTARPEQPSSRLAVVEATPTVVWSDAADPHPIVGDAVLARLAAAALDPRAIDGVRRLTGAMATIRIDVPDGVDDGTARFQALRLLGTIAARAGADAPPEIVQVWRRSDPDPFLTVGDAPQPVALPGAAGLQRIADRFGPPARLGALPSTLVFGSFEVRGTPPAIDVELTSRRRAIGAAALEPLARAMPPRGSWIIRVRDRRGAVIRSVWRDGSFTGTAGRVTRRAANDPAVLRRAASDVPELGTAFVNPGRAPREVRPALLTATRLAFDDRSLSIDRPSSFPDGTDPWAADLTGALAAQALALTPVGRRPPDPRPTWSLVRPSDAPPELPRPILRLTHPWRRAAAARAAKALQAVVIPLCDRAPGRLCLDATALQYGATVDVQLTLGRWDGRRHALWTTTVRAVRRALTARHVTNPVLVHLLDLAHPGLPRWSWWRFVTTAGVHERRAISPG